VKRIKLKIAPGVETEFVDRDRALAQVAEWAEKSTRWPVVIFGPEGCGKTAFLRQAASGLRELGYDVFYLHPLDRVFAAEVDDPDVKTLFLELVRKTLEDEKWGRMALAVFDLTREILKKRRRKIAVIADDVFQAIGLDKAAAYVKGLLNMIEHPVYNYESIVVLIATSEGVSRGEIGRHRWAYLRPMWNMPREGLQQLYDRIPGAKPPFEDVWRWTGGNPEMLVKLYRSGWAVERVVGDVLRGKRLTAEFVRRWRRWLEAGRGGSRCALDRRRAGGACQRAGGEELNSIQHVRQRPLLLDRRPAAREGSRARHWEERRLADADTQRGGEEGAEGGVGRLFLPLGSCGVRGRRGLSAPTLGLWLIRARLGQGCSPGG
jgi:hypothetical protein